MSRFSYRKPLTINNNSSAIGQKLAVGDTCLRKLCHATFFCLVFANILLYIALAELKKRSYRGLHINI